MTIRTILARGASALLLPALAIAGLAISAADSAEPWNYPGTDLLDICTQADNESRLLGQLAEVECEQYMIGFTDALIAAGDVGPSVGICLPERNRPDEVRWAFTLWVNENFDRRHEPSARLVLAALRDKFPCE